MARVLTMEDLAKRYDKWHDQGLNYALVESAKASMEIDRAAAVARVRKKSGDLAGSIRLTEPSATRTRRKGYFRISLVAGSRSKSKPIVYAGVLQEGKTFDGKTRTKGHWIPKLSLLKRVSASLGRATGIGGGVKLPGGAIRRAVWHPGSRLVKLEYMRVDLVRATQKIHASITKSVEAAL